MSCADELLSECRGTTWVFRKSIVEAYNSLFEDDQSTQASQDSTVPVNTDNVVNSASADAIPAQLKTAQTAAKAVTAEEKKLEDLKKTANDTKQTLQDTLNVASNDTQAQQSNQNTQQDQTNAST